MEFVYRFASHCESNQAVHHPLHRRQSRPCAWRKRNVIALLGSALALLWCTSSHASSKLQGTTLQGTTLQGTTLQGTTLQGTTLQGTTLQGTTLQGTTLRLLYPVSDLDCAAAR
jgi:hypothetical protein